MEGYKFYVINLERSQYRLNTMKKLYDHNLVRVNAFDGNELHTYKNIALPNDENNIISKYEYAVSLSHIKAIWQAYKDGLNEVFIIEDDIHNHCHDLWQHNLQTIIKNKPSNAECISFMCINAKITKEMIKCKGAFIKLREKHWGAGCYYITRNGMHKIVKEYIQNNKIDLSFPIHCDSKGWPVSHIADRDLIFKKLISYSYTRPTFIDEGKTSTIHPQHLTAHHTNRIVITGFLNNRYINSSQQLVKNTLNKIITAT